MPALRLLPLHPMLSPLQYSRHSRSSQALECDLQPVCWSYPRSGATTRSCVSIYRMVKLHAGDLDIIVPMWINCQIDPWHFQLSGIWAASAICLQVNPRAAIAIHHATKAVRHCREGIARTGCRLNEYQECADHQYKFHPQALRKHADLLSYQVVEKLNTPLVHMLKVTTSGLCHMRLEQSWLVPNCPWPRQPKEDNIVSGIQRQNTMSRQVRICQDFWVGTALFHPWNAMPCQYFWLISEDSGSAQWRSRCAFQVWGAYLCEFQQLEISGHTCWAPKNLLNWVLWDALWTGTVVALAASWSKGITPLNACDRFAA